MGVLITSVWTQKLQDPLHREEWETCFTSSMDYGKQNFWVSLKIQILLDHFVLKLIQICYIQIRCIQFCIKSYIWYKLYYTNLYIKRAPKKILKSVKKWSPFIPRYAGICRISTKEKKLIPYKPYVLWKHIESILGTCKNKKSIQFE
jgi:hypothetical protein